MPHRLTTFLILACLFLAAGCSATTAVMLDSTPRAISGLRCSGVYNVVVFENAKLFQAIGQRDDQPLYPANTDVGRWAADAVAQQFGALGCEAVIVDKPTQAHEKWVVTGTVREAFAQQTGLLSYNTTLVVQFNLLQGTKKVWGKKVKVSTEKTAAVPSSDHPGDYLSEAMSDAAAEVVPDIIRERAGVK